MSADQTNLDRLTSVRQRNVENLRRYFVLLERNDLEQWITLWDPDCTQLIPYASGDLPGRIEGRDDVHRLYQRINAGFRAINLTDRQLFPLQDEDRIFARWRPRCELPNGEIYTNENVGLFEFNPGTGLIRQYTEYFNPTGFSAE